MRDGVVRVATLPPTGECFELTLSGAELEERWGGAIEGLEPGPITATVHLRPEAGGVWLEGVVRWRGHAACRRCLAPVAFTHETEVRLRFEPDPAVRTGEVELAPEELDVVAFRDGCVDLAAWLAEQAALDAPERLLCDEACPGLCVRCGEPRSRCGCEAEVDPRWAALASLRR